MKAIFALGIVYVIAALANADHTARQTVVVPFPSHQHFLAPQRSLPSYFQRQQILRSFVLFYLIKRLREDDDDGDNDDCDTHPWYKATNGCYYRRFFSTLRTYSEAKAYCPTQCNSKIATKGMRDNFVIKTEILNAVDFDVTSPGVWIGLEEISDTAWKWADGVPSTIYDRTSSPNGNTNWKRIGMPVQPVVTPATECGRVANDEDVNTAEFSASVCTADHAVLCEYCP